MKHKILFLDLDGVLNSEEFAVFGDFEFGAEDIKHKFSPELIKHVNTICDKTGAKIVLTSTWRNRSDLESTLQTLGLKYSIHGRTPVLTKRLESGLWTKPERGVEIQKYLNEHADSIGNYVILDDDVDMLDHQLEYFVHVNNRVGLSGIEVKKAIEILNRK